MAEREDRRKVKVGDSTVTLQRRHATLHPEFAPPPHRQPPPENNEPKMRAVVAPGRTVHCAVPGQFETVGFDTVNRVAVRRQRQKSFGPGQEVELPLSEIERLQQLGFLHDPSRYASDEEAAALPPTPTPQPAAS